MERMFPESIEFVKVNQFVIKDTKSPYDRYWNKDKGKWVGLIPATRFTKEEVDTLQAFPENGEVKNFDDVIKGK